MRVLFSIDSLQAGGAEKSTLDIIHHLSADVKATVVYYYGKHDLKADFEQAPCQLIYIPLDKGYRFGKGVRQLLRLIRREKIDIIVTTLYRSGIMSRIAGSISGVPVVDTIVNDSYSAAKRSEFAGIHGIKFHVVKQLDRMTASIPKLWLSNSDAIAQTMQKALHINPARIKTIYRGRDIDVVTPWQAPESMLPFRFVAAGRLVAQKGFADLIDAFVSLYKRNNHITLTIYGEGKDRASLQSSIDTASMGDCIMLAGRVPNVWKEFSKAHCFVLPSHYEGLSGVLIEAMLSGIPVIASDIPMNVEAAANDAVTFFRAGNAVSLADAMDNLMQHYSRAIIKAESTAIVARKKFDIREIAAQYQQALIEVVKNNSLA